MKRVRVLPSLLVLTLSLPLAAQEEFEIVLRVNDRIATTWDYYRLRGEKAERIQAAENLPAERRQRLLANLGVSTMNDLFEELLMLSRADQLGLRVTDADVERAISTSRQNLGITTEEQFQQALAASNMTLDSFKKTMEKNLLVQQLMSQEVHPRVTLEEEDLRRYYQKHSEEFTEPERLHLEEVVVLSDSGLTADEMMETAAGIRRQAEAGEGLAEIVTPFVDRGVVTNPVDLGWVELGDLDPQLEKAVWSLQAGGVSEPVEARGGLHVLEVLERQEARLLDFAEVENRIRASEGERLMSFEMQKYLEELETEAYVVANPPPDAAGFRASLDLASDTDHLEEALTAPLITEPSPAAAPPAPTDEESGSEEPPAAGDSDGSSSD